MTIEILSIFTGAGLVVAFAIGFLCGVKSRKADEIVMFKRGYDFGRKTQKALTDERMEREWNSFIENFGEEEEIKYGRF